MFSQVRGLSSCKYLYLGSVIAIINISYVAIKIRVMSLLLSCNNAPSLKSSEFILDVTEYSKVKSHNRHSGRNFPSIPLFVFQNDTPQIELIFTTRVEEDIQETE